MAEKLVGNLVAKLPPGQRLVGARPKLGVHVDHLRVRVGEVGHVVAHQLPDQIVVEAGTVCRGHDDRDVGHVLRRHEHDRRVLGDLGVGVAGFENLQPRDVDGHDPQVFQLKLKMCCIENLPSIEKGIYVP